MLFRTFTHTELKLLFELLSYNYLIGSALLARAPDNTPVYGFRHLEKYEELTLHYPTTAHSPKTYFLPHLRTLATYEIHDHSWQKHVSPPDETPTVMFGLHPCDINGLNRLDRILLNGKYPDPFYAARRRNTFIVGISCQPSPQCFCKSVGCDRALHGYDMFLTDLGECIFCEINSGAAYEVLQGIDSHEADHRDHALFVKAQKVRDGDFVCHVETADLTRILDMEFTASAWRKWGERCLSCGTCANVCPTCYCYGTEHVVDISLTAARKDMRLYSCNLVDFAAVAENRNFRPESENRIKYRYYHKHRGFVEVFEESLCVGCGRCGRACLSGINVPEVIASIRAEAESNE